MYKYSIIFLGMCLIGSSALASDSVGKINEPRNLGEFAVEEMWHPKKHYKNREDFSDNHNKYFKTKLTTNLWESDSISFPLTFKINNLEIPKARLTFKITF